MFSISPKVLASLKTAILPVPELALLGPKMLASCASCTGSCTNSCRGGCKGSCQGGCTRSCKGHSR